MATVRVSIFPQICINIVKDWETRIDSEHVKLWSPGHRSRQYSNKGKQPTPYGVGVGHDWILETMPELLCYVLLFYFAVAVGRMMLLLVTQCRYTAMELCYTAELIGAELLFKNP